MNLGSIVFIVSLITLSLELILTRVFDVILTSNISYTIITCAMLSFGLAGVYSTLNPVKDNRNITNYITRLLWMLMLSIILIRPIINFLALRYIEYPEFTSLLLKALVKIGPFLLIYLILMVPFFLSGLILITIFSHFSVSIHRLYFYDLLGASIGCLIFIPILPLFGPGGLMYFISATVSILLTFNLKNKKHALCFSALAILLLLLPFSYLPRVYEFSEMLDKRDVKTARIQGKIEFSKWDPISKIDVVSQNHIERGTIARLDISRVSARGDTILSVLMKNGILKEISSTMVRLSGKKNLHEADIREIAKDDFEKVWSILQQSQEIKPLLSRKHIAYDGGSQSSHFFPFDGDFNSLRNRLFTSADDECHFWGRSVITSHYIKRDSGQKVLIIGSAGGQETKAALMYGAAYIDAIEMVGTVVALGKGRYAPYIGNIFNNPRVHVYVEEGRRFLNSHDDLYDIIQIYSNHTSSSLAAGIGAMQTAYLQTVEAYEEYFRHLKPEGILHINHHIYPRMITTAAVAWKRLGRENFKKHVLVFEDAGQPDTIPTVLLKMTPWTEAEVREIENFLSLPSLKWEVPYRIAENPLSADKSFLSQDFYEGELSSAFFDSLDYRAYPATDNRPYFTFLRKHLGILEVNPKKFVNTSVAEHLNSQLLKSLIPMDIFHFCVVGLVSLLFACILVFFPLLFSEVGRQHWPAKKGTHLYFSCLGAGFIIFELTFIHVFMKFIGSPLYTFSLVVSTMLLAAGIGSFTSGKIGITPFRFSSLPFIGIFVYGTLLTSFSNYIFNAFLSEPLFIRLAISFFMISPLAFFLGMPFPLGIIAIQKFPRGAIAWAWGMNSIFTVIGGFATVIFSIFYGFQFTLYMALCIYLLAFITFSRIRKSM